MPAVEPVTVTVAVVGAVVVTVVVVVLADVFAHTIIPETKRYCFEVKSFVCFWSADKDC